ncbi:MULTISPECIES: hypothetical protein [unclassified Ruegeria]|uniref:hypothetical protein n=1 Tax=unclassified Ruegeria TaxID=2625375 RepID=UPI001492D4DD|nr:MULTISPECIES: hypothetical protein [unclassified Ruegeria]NOD87895.1 hypothetical protein [Ruegeria sp. HKCCD4318]NOE14265.1 hypothetical protein [Ruegeria sp. HKCCD4318-2]NOG08378.1 hypothetical protein [Ruegeria sp. HKCCD4315]
MTAVYNKAGVFQRDMTLPEGLSYSRVKGTQLYQLGKWDVNAFAKRYGGQWWPYYVHADDLPPPEAARKRKRRNAV